MQKIRWGIIGAGNIARSFAQDVQRLPNAEVLAIGSRSIARARQFATDLQLPRSYSSYEELAADPEIDVVYIATPHVFHKEQSILCLHAGKPVLVEKPFTMTADEAREVVGIAREKDLFCMEAMWMRFIPAMRKAVSLIQDGVIGEIQMVSANLGFYNEFDPDHRLFNPDLGGGAMLDLGIYPLSLTYQLLGKPTAITSQATVGQTGIDEQAAALLEFQGGQIAVLSTNLRAVNRNDALIMGTQGSIQIHSPIFKPNSLRINQFASPIDEVKKTGIVSRVKDNQVIRKIYQTAARFVPQLKGEQVIEIKCDGNGYGYEAIEVIHCLQSGQKESEIMPSDETIAIMEVMDSIRDQWNRSN